MCRRCTTRAYAFKKLKQAFGIRSAEKQERPLRRGPDAAHAVLAAAGGDLWAADGSPMRYNAKESVLNPEFVAVGDAGFGWRDKLPSVPA